MTQNPIPEYIFKRTESRDSNRYLHTHVQSSIIHNSQKVEAPQVPINRWKDKQMWCVCLCMSMCTSIYNSILLVTLYIIRLPNIYNGVIFKLKKEVNHNTCHTCMSLKEHYAKRNKPDKNNKYCLIPLKWNTQGSQIQSQGVGRKEWEVNGYRISDICCLAPKKCHGLQHTRLPCSLFSPSLLKFMPIELAMLSNHLILCRALFLRPSIFPSIRLFLSESALHIRWPKY